MINIYKSVLLYRKHIWIIVRRPCAVGTGIMNSRGPARNPLSVGSLISITGPIFAPRSLFSVLPLAHALSPSFPFFFLFFLSLSLAHSCSLPSCPSRFNVGQSWPRTRRIRRRFHLLSPRGGPPRSTSLATASPVRPRPAFVSPNSTRSRTLIVFSLPA